MFFLALDFKSGLKPVILNEKNCAVCIESNNRLKTNKDKYFKQKPIRTNPCILNMTSSK